MTSQSWPAIPFGVGLIWFGTYAYRRAEQLAQDTKDFFLDEKQKAAFDAFQPRIRPLVGGVHAAFQSSSYKSLGVSAIFFGILAILVGIGSQH
jgi:hypothetical protein